MKKYLLLFLFSINTTSIIGADKLDFNRDVRPIIADTCFACHGPDAKQRKADLRLDTKEGLLSVVQANKPEQSDLFQRLVTKDHTELMPPPETKKTLKPQQIEVIRNWIVNGATFESHWAFEMPKLSPPPTVVREDFELRNEIDAFVAAQWQKVGLVPNTEADRRTLIRRLYFDLTGLPPTFAEVEAFVHDTAPDAYEKLVLQLLSSARFGERLAVDWLDAARYADTNGYHIDNGRDMTLWRDWVIKAFNQNKSYRDFTIEQIAGDLLPNPTLEQRIATGFNRNHMINFEGGANPAEYHNAYIVDRVNTVSTIWLGLTVACAQCHDHKYDPISQEDYYRLYAFFNNVPENGLDGRRGNAVPILRVPDLNQKVRLDQLQQEIAKLEKSRNQPNPRLLEEQAKWEKQIGTNTPTWDVAEIASITSQGKGIFRKETDGTWWISGSNPPRDVYTIRTKITAPITGFRLDVLADKRLSAGGPGRSENGNFVLTEVHVYQGQEKNFVRKEVIKYDASFSQAEYPVRNLATGKNGWAIYPATGKDHSLVFTLKEPLDPKNGIVAVQLGFESRFAQHQIGKLQLYTTSDSSPSLGKPLPKLIRTVLKVPASDRGLIAKQILQQYYQFAVSTHQANINQQIVQIQQQMAAMEAQMPSVMVMSEMAQPRDTFILERGQFDKKGKKVTSGTPSVLPALPKGTSQDRLGLARWLVSENHPLTARVTVNRYWQMIFGRGLVDTSEDFGTQGQFPSHPQLLDWLAVDFINSGWDVKKLLKQMVLSSTYRLGSQVTPEQLKLDPTNIYLARAPRYRLSAEFIRDQALFVSGLMQNEIGGKSVFPYQPPGLWEALMSRTDGANWTAQKYTPSSGSDLYRRSMYTFWKRTSPPAAMATLDAPDRETCTIKRSVTNTPLQALVLLNDPTYVEAARKLAEKIVSQPGKDEELIQRVFNLALQRPASEQETQVVLQLLKKQRQIFDQDAPSARKLLQVGESTVDSKLDAKELFTWTTVFNALLNLDEALTRQ